MGPDAADGVSGSGDQLGVAGGTLLFTGTMPQTGSEPWKYVPSISPAPAAVAGRYVFYNNSSFDGNDAGANAADDGAIATDRQALLPGEAATTASYTNYSRGLNGIMIDVANLPAGTDLGAQDFQFKTGTGSGPSQWTNAPAPSSVTVRRGAGVNGPDRVTLLWSDNAIQNGWLRVTVLPTSRTGLQRPDVFYFDNLVGDTLDNPAAAAMNALDLGRIRAAQLQSSQPVTSRMDLNHDGRVNAVDPGISRSNQLRTLAMLGSTDTAAVAIEAQRVSTKRDDESGATGLLHEPV